VSTSTPPLTPDVPDEPPAVRPRPSAPVLVVAGVALAVLLGWAALALRGGPEQDPAELERQLAAARAGYSALVHARPVPLRGRSTGVLEDGDALSRDGHFEDVYAYTAADTAAFSFIATSEAFAPDLFVLAPDGRRVAASALLQTGHRAVVTGLRGRGRYRLVVTSRRPGMGGPYELSVERPPPPRTIEPDEEPDEDTLGTLGTPRAGRYEATYAIPVEADEALIVTVAARTFMPRLYVLGPEGDLTPRLNLERRPTDTLRTVAARFVPAWTAPYTLLVSSDERGARGAYTLTVEKMRTVIAIEPGRAFSKNLGERSGFRDNRYLDVYRFGAERGDRIVVELRTRAFEPRIVLRHGEEVLAEGVRRIEREAPASALFEVDVTSAEPNLTGDYTIAVTTTPPTPPAPDTSVVGPPVPVNPEDLPRRLIERLRERAQRELERQRERQRDEREDGE